MRLRDHNKADLALAAVTVAVSALAVGSEVGRWAARHLRRAHGPGGDLGPASRQPPRS
jgi:hypothetical protein